MSLISTVRERRAAAGLSQAELAARAGISRQALSAIEAGRQVPSTTLALVLARCLGCEVDALFRLAEGPVLEARLAGEPGRARRLVLGRVDGALVAHPLASEARAADGLLLERAGERASVELVGDPSDLDAHVLVAGCAPLLGLLAERLERRDPSARASWIPANSGQALELLEQRLVHVAGVHLAGEDDPEAHVRAAQRVCPGEPAHLINLARWRQGLVIAPGNPLGVELGPALQRPELRFAQRDPGAGAQRLLERTLRSAGAVPGEGPRARDHAEVARMVRWGVADLGVAIESVATAEGLDFLPLVEERFDLIVPASRLDHPAVARFLALIDRPAFRAEASRLPGYDLSLAGHASTVP